jgi:hypothetical protein
VDVVRASDLEFFHAGLLDPEQTVEASAFMKNDRIGVYPNQREARETIAEALRLQRESDWKYFEDLRSLFKESEEIFFQHGGLTDERSFPKCNAEDK